MNGPDSPLPVKVEARSPWCEWCGDSIVGDVTRLVDGGVEMVFCAPSSGAECVSSWRAGLRRRAAGSTGPELSYDTPDVAGWDE